MTPYKPGKPISETQREFGLTHVIKLASNENPLGPSPKALAAIRTVLDRQHRYPDPSAYDLLTTLSRVWSVPREHMSIGNGSDEIIDLLCRIYCLPGEGVLTSDKAFQAYAVSAAANRLRLHTTPLTPDWRFDLPAMADYFLKQGEAQKIRLIFIANPNNPTGTFVTRAEMESFFQKLGGRDDVLIVFDEAYTEFLRAPEAASAMDYLAKVPNLVVLRTFSKVYGLAGLRVGTLIAPTSVVDVYNRVRKPFNVNDLAQVAAAAAVEDHEFLQSTREVTWRALDYFTPEIRALGLEVLDSQANFVLFDTRREALKMDQALLRRGLIMRPVLNYGLRTHLRLSAGLPDENQAALRALKEALSEIPEVGG